MKNGPELLFTKQENYHPLPVTRRHPKVILFIRVFKELSFSYVDLLKASLPFYHKEVQDKKTAQRLLCSMDRPGCLIYPGCSNRRRAAWPAGKWSTARKQYVYFRLAYFVTLSIGLPSLSEECRCLFITGLRLQHGLTCSLLIRQHLRWTMELSPESVPLCRYH